MAKHFRPYDFNLSANGSQVVYAVGKYLKLLSATGGVSIRVDGGSALPMTVGQGLELEDGETWSEITITDTSGGTNTGKLFIGAGRFTDQSGQMTLMNDPDGVRGLMGQSYRSGIDKTFAGAGNEGHGLYNPTASTKRLVLRSIELIDSAVANIQQRLITKYTVYSAAPNAATSTRPIGAGNTLSLGGVYVDPGSPGGTSFYADASNVLTVTGKRQYRALVLDPGQGVHVFHSATAAAKLATVFEWDEVPI